MGIITSRDVDFLSNDCKHRSLGDVSDTIIIISMLIYLQILLCVYSIQLAGDFFMYALVFTVEMLLFVIADDSQRRSGGCATWLYIRRSQPHSPD